MHSFERIPSKGQLVPSMCFTRDMRLGEAI